jgi:hypothetical protein
VSGAIDESVISAVNRVLGEVRDYNLEAGGLEIQDDGHIIPKSVQVADSLSLQMYSVYCEPLTRALSAIGPPRKHDYPWMVVF